MKRQHISIPEMNPQEIRNHHADVQAALRAYFDPRDSHYEARFFGRSKMDVEKTFQERLREAGRQAALVLLTGIEAAFRLDYRQRVENRRKDDLSRTFRDLDKSRGQSVRLDEDLFESWRAVSGLHKQAISNLRSAFKFRNWMAHGRYWEPVPGRYEFKHLYEMAIQTFELMEFDR